MVNPIYIVAAALGVAFLLPLFDRLGKTVVNVIFLSTTLFLTFVSAQWLVAFTSHNIQAVQIFTAGVKPPLSINLQMGLQEALFLTGINLLALVSALYLIRTLNGIGIRSQVLFLLFTLGMNGLVMTRDIFNLFVFMEITSIAGYALIGMDLRLNALSAGFKYMIAGSIASIFLLLGIIFLYSVSGTLNIDGMLHSAVLKTGAPLIGVALFMLLFSFFIEMKQFPANGWALDVYQGAHPGIAAMISAGSSGAIFFALSKILPLGGTTWFLIAAGAGMTTFVVSNLMGLKQQHTTRMLGYSSVGQMGLLLATLGLGFYLENSGLNQFRFIIAALFFNHFFAKAGLYWLAGVVGRDSIKEWGVLRGKMLYQFLMGLFVLSLLAFPPFAGFWGKWSLVMALAEHGMFGWIAVLLIGSLLEAVYLLRWFGYAIRGEAESTELAERAPERSLVLGVFAVLALVAGYLASRPLMPHSTLFFLPFLAAAVLFVLDWLPARLKGALTILIVALYAARILPELQGFAYYFNIIFLGGGSVLLIATLHRTDRSVGFYPLMVLMLGALSNLVLATNLLQFFFAWELMTVASYLLIIRGKRAQTAALSYVLFSLGGAYALLTGFALAHASQPVGMGMEILRNVGDLAPAVYILISLGFLAKVAAIGLHIWAPGAYGEAEDDVTPMISGILSKAGILGFVVLFVYMGIPSLGTISLNTILGWIGVLTALFATLFAIFQEDAKKLLAYSSVGQVGYIVLGLAAMSHLGWAAALWHTLNHMLFKGLLFLAVAGVIYRTGTRNMYEMGGLIKRMPLSFVSVMMGIIALSGVPPLTGFGGKWLLYEALIERGWYLQTGVAFFASTVAFLYCYRLIHAIFLGVPKPKYLHIKEAPAWFLVPQYILIAFIMIYSIRPDKLLKPISAIIAPVFAPTLRWDNLTVYNGLGYWDGTMTMIVIGAIFVVLLIYMMFIVPKPQKVKPFNIVYAAEKPERPETTHYAWQFFTPYTRAMAPILKPLVKRFWATVSEWTHTSAAVVRQIYTGNGQTYALFIFITALIIYFVSTGVH